MTLDELAYKLYDADRSHQSKPTVPWNTLTCEYQDYWRGLAMLYADALGVNLEPAPDPRYTAALAILDGNRSVGRDYLNDSIARAIVAALDAKPG